MKIGIDARVLSFKRIGGVRTYAYNLIINLAKIDHKNEYIIYHNFPDNLTFRRGNFKVKIIQTVPYDFFKEQIILTYEITKDKIDVFHSLFFLPPLVRLAKTIFTVHDLNPEERPELYQDKKMSSYFRKWRKKIIEKTDRIITVSNYVKKRIEESLLIDGMKIRVTHLATSEMFWKVADKDLFKKVSKKYFIGGSFLLYVGHIQPWKNLVRLIKAFRLIKEKGLKEKLVLVGGMGWEAKEIKRLIDELNLEREVIMTDFISDEDLPLLYQNSSAFVLPSLIEGFGIPLLEAMASGVPVIASNATSIPEVVGDAAILFDPLDIDDMAKTIYTVLSNNTLREDLVKKGWVRAKEFSWEKMAKETLEIYNELFLY